MRKGPTDEEFYEIQHDIRLELLKNAEKELELDPNNVSLQNDVSHHRKCMGIVAFELDAIRGA